MELLIKFRKWNSVDNDDFLSKITKLSGIYIIRNFIDDRIYVGSAKKFYTRLNNHENTLDRQIHNSIHLQRFYNKYGKESLWVEIIELCSLDVLIEREQFYLDTLKPFKQSGFNTAEFANSCLGIKHSEETKKKMSIAQKNRGEFSEKHRKNLSISLCWTKNPIYGKERSLETKLKMANNQSRPLVQFGSTGEFIKIWNSAYEASLELDIPKEKIRKAGRAKTRRVLAGSYLWRFLYDEKPRYNFSKERASNMKDYVNTKICVYDSKGLKLNEFFALKEAARELGMNQDTIGNACKNGKELNGFFFKREKINA